MRKIKIPGLLWVFLAGCFAFFLSGCRKATALRTRTYTYTLHTPVYGLKSDVYAAINGYASRTVETAGKIYIKDKFIYLNEVDKGIHIIDNSDPSHPAQVAFLNIPGNHDMAVKGNTLYADLSSDLLAIDISNPKKVSITGFVSNFFTQNIYYGTNSDSNLIVVKWIDKDTTITITDNNVYSGCDRCAVDFFTANSGNPLASSAGGKSNGIAGSMAAMVLIDNYIYAITERHSIGIVDVTNDATPVFKSSVYAGFDLETIYPFEGKLFLGSAVGMFMYNISNPINPVALGTFSHGRACDPVITDGDYAYVTLHAGTECGGDANELNIVNVKDLMNPTLVKSYPLTKPTGLSKDGNILFICDDTSGVRVYDASDPADIKLLQQISSNAPYDIITGNKLALLVAKDGLYQYDYSNLNNIRQLSFFSLKN